MAPRAAIWLVVLLSGWLAVGAAGCLQASDSGAGGPAKVRVVDSLTTVRLDQPTPTDAAAAANLLAARNEFESFQVIVDAGARLRRVKVGLGAALRGPGGARIPAENLTFFREVAYPVGAENPPSDSEGGEGLWPDALIPAKDYLYGERRSAFPVDMTGGGRLVAWVDVLVPPNQPAGTYRGTVAVTSSTGTVARVPVTLEVLGFRLPSTSSLRSAFGLDWTLICKAHTGSGDCRGNLGQRWLLDSLYARAGLENRLTLSIPAATDSDEPPRSGAESQLFRRMVVPLLRGDNSIPLRGARLTTMNLSWSCLDDPNCLDGWQGLGRRYGFANRLSLYLCDEPFEDPGLWRECRSRAARADAQRPGFPKLVTATIQRAEAYAPSLLPEINTLVPGVNDMLGETGSGNQRPAYDAFLRSPGRSLWLYTACYSFSCDESESPIYDGWPGYAIDEPASQARAMGWLAFAYGATGELYYQSVARLPTAWRTQYLSGGNGDGTLFYPGSPRGSGTRPAIGGKHAIPIESIRLKRIRDGREDYEYLRILSQGGQYSAALATVEQLFGPLSVAMRNTTVTPGALQDARARLADLIR